VADTVLIASPDHLAALKGHSSFAGAQSFLDADALKALEVITRDKPKLIILERTFAATSRGAALIKRIKADPALVRCEIKIVAHDGSQTSGKKKDGGASDPVASAAEAAARAAAAPPVPAKAPLDQRGTRRAPRYQVAKGIEVIIDGKPATLINLSIVGAQVVSATILRPNQRVRMILPDTERPLRFAGGVAWAAFEMPKAGPHYRAGIEFFDAEAENLDRFIATNKA
jgi:PilZ domain-containing protein